MRCSPKRIVLAAIAFIVGAVLALPTLLSRKAEAAGAPPMVEALACANSVLASDAADEQAPAQDCTGSDERCCNAALVSASNPSRQFRPSEHGPASPGISPTLSASHYGRLDLLAYVFASPAPAPWPTPQTIDRKRKYHLRP